VDETTFDVWRVQGVDVVRVTGVLDFAAAIRLRLTLFGCMDSGARHIAVDLARVRLLDASAVNVLMRVRDRVAADDGSLVARGATGIVLEVLEIAGVAKLLGAHEQLAERLADPAGGAGDPAGGAGDPAGGAGDPAGGAGDPAVEARRGAHGHWGDEINKTVGRMHAEPAGSASRRALRERLIGLCLPFAERLARRFSGLGEPSADLAQVAAIGLLKAVDRYDPQLGTDFAAYATPTIVGELKRHFRDRGWAVRVPRRLQELCLDINRARNELNHELNRAPTVADLARHLDVDQEQIIEAVAASSGYRAVSLSTPIGGEDDGMTLLDSLGSVDARIEGVDARETLRPLLAALPKREREIITMRFYGNLTQSQIAEQVGISQMHVSRLLTRTLVRLREGMLAGD
jgi:RNA polymerase sigma-B factor